MPITKPKGASSATVTSDVHDLKLLAELAEMLMSGGV